MIKKLLLVGLTALLISTASADELLDCQDTVIDQEEKIVSLEKDNAVMKEKLAARYIFRFPFTDIGVTGDHVQGFVTGAIVMVILL